MKKYRMELKGFDAVPGYAKQHLLDQLKLLVVVVHVPDSINDVVNDVTLGECHNRPAYVEYVGEDTSGAVPDVVFKPYDVSEAVLGKQLHRLRLICASRILQSDNGNNAEELEAKYAPDGNCEHPVLTRKNWRSAVELQTTILGYWQWVEFLISTQVVGIHISSLTEQYG